MIFWSFSDLPASLYTGFSKQDYNLFLLQSVEILFLIGVRYTCLKHKQFGPSFINPYFNLPPNQLTY